MKTSFQELSPQERETYKEPLQQKLSQVFVTTIAPQHQDVMEDILKEASFSPTGNSAITLGAYFDTHLLPIAKEQKVPEETIREIQKQLGKSGKTTISEFLDLETPIKDHPIVGKEYRKTEARKIGNFVGLKGSKLDKFTEHDIKWDEANQATVNRLIQDKIVSKTQGKNLLWTSDMARLTGDNISFIEALKKKKVKSLFELVSWTRTDWVNFIKSQNISLPTGEASNESYAKNIHTNLKTSFPTQFLGNRLKETDLKATSNSLKSVQGLYKNNPKILSGRVVKSHELNWKGISAAEKKKIEPELLDLNEFANTYEGLGIRDIINDPETSVKDKEGSIKDRLGAFGKFQENNPLLELGKTDLLNGKELLNWNGIKEEDKEPIQKQTLGMQRVAFLSNDPETSERLLKQGFDSAMAIASISEDQFYERSKLEYETSRNVYLSAKNTATVTANYFEAVRDGMLGTFQKLGVNNQKDLVNDLKEINGFDDLFGNQDFCNCEHCRSIFGAAAYFTDLMYFIQEHVSEKHFVPSLTDHPLYLKNRRPDLWDLQLTCENTNTEIAYLSIVNEVLESYLKTAEGIKDPYKFIFEADYFTRLPVNLPLQELRTYLGHFGESLLHMYQILDLSDEYVLRESLGLGKEEVSLISTVDPDQTYIRFGSVPLNTMSVQYFLEMTGLERVQLDQVLLTTFYSDMSKIKIKQIKDNTTIQKFTEKFEGLTKTRLDVLYRLLLLWKKTSWTILEFDLIMNGLKNKSIVTNLTGKTPAGYPKFLLLGHVLQFQAVLDLSAEELAAVMDGLPIKSIKEEQEPFFNRIFDLETLFGIASVLPDGEVIYNPTFKIPVDKTEDDKSALIIAGLGISESDLLLLFELLNIDTETKNIDHKILSELYKNAHIAKGLGWTVEELVSVCSLLLQAKSIGHWSDISELIDFNSWLEPSPFRIADLDFVLFAQESTSNIFEATLDGLAARVLTLQNDYDSQFPEDTIIDEAVKKEALVESLLIHLEDTFTLTRTQLIDQFNIDVFNVDIIAAVDQAAGAEFTNDGLAEDLSDFDDLLTIEKELERWKVLLDKTEFDETQLTFLIEHPDVFSISDLRALQIENIHQLILYKNLKDTIEADKVSTLNLVLLDYLDTTLFSTDSISSLNELWGFSESLLLSIIQTMSLGTIPSEVLTKMYHLTSLADTFGIEGHSLVKLSLDDYEEIKIARDIVVGAISAKYPEEAQRNETLEFFEETIHTIKRDALCDAIIGNKAVYKFSDRTDLYNFFLLDVDMSACFKTSRIVCANSSLQQYINRCLINLEQSDETLNPNIVDVQVSPNDIPVEEWTWRKNYRVWQANRTVFLYPENYIDPALRDTKTDIFKELEDELLQEKITESSAEEAYKNYMAKFSELTRLRYAGAYYESKPNDYGYLPFAVEESSVYLSVTGSTFNVESTDSIYYLFARTNTDPYQYYYRTFHNSGKIWGNWIKMDVAIEAEEISALIYHGKLYVFWTSAIHKEVSKLEDGNSIRIGQDFKVYANYCYQKEDGTWTTPQKTYVGHTLESEHNVFQRVLGEDFTGYDEEDDEDKMESVLREFGKQVFKKPYAIINQDNAKAPIKLHYLFTNGQGVVQHEYQLPDSTVTVDDFMLSIPGYTFSYIGEQVIRPVEIVFTGDYWEMAPLTIDAVVICTGPIRCNVDIDVTLKLKILGVDYNFTLKQTIALDLSDNAEALSVNRRAFNLSLSKNSILNQTIEDIKENSTVLTSSNFLKPEYDVAFADEDVFEHFIETGSTSFTETSRSINQGEDGTAQLTIPDIIGGLETIPLTTILTDEIIDALYAQGLESFLSLQVQNATTAAGETFNMKGSYGEYYWEMFFHIPFLIASHLNANQKFKEAKWWYERIFNPTNMEDPNNPDSMDHLWQFREFQNLDVAKLEDILTDTNAIEAYKNDPFDPHAIARLRITAYQKAIVMKYIDNLLDWADYLFTQDTREAIMEALQYYQLALGLLGKRPIKIGECDTPAEESLTYEHIKDKIAEGSEFLITLENSYILEHDNYFNNLLKVSSSKHLSSYLIGKGYKEPSSSLSEVRKDATYVDMRAPIKAEINKATVNKNFPKTKSVKATPDQNWVERNGRIKKYDEVTPDVGLDTSYEFKKVWKDEDILTRDLVVETVPRREQAFQIVKESMLVFCIPENGDLMAYWDRVEDRLFKIRNCMNMSGVVRSLSLFAPKIDPNFLVRAAASGLSLEDAIQLALTSDFMPNYRFAYLVEKARQYAQTVQGFGATLLSAMEKKDVEELTLLRAVHEQNILKLSLDIKKKQIDDAEHGLKNLQESLVNIENRLSYYTGLVESGLNTWETTQLISKHTATITRGIEGAMHLTEGIAFLIPNAGSPFAMTYGGKELGNSADGFAAWLSSMASVAESISQSAGMEANFQRREEEWNHQKKSAKLEIKAMEQQILGAELRKLIAEKDKEIQENSIDNAKEVHDFYKNKFTALGLYNHLSANLNRIYREAYNMALGMAKLAEKSFQIETFDDTFFIANDNWETDRAGLLAADRLLIQLQQMESSFIENNSRKPEIRQTFSMALLDPSQLVELKQTGTCTFAIPEIAFELLYPGQIQRVIKGVNITIPCITGPYTNIGATLSLTSSKLKKQVGEETLEYTVGIGSSISTSGGVNDSGMFEFNFRDERYLPFEGAGAISEWKLELPSSIRAFDYNTISDVLITLNYTALEGDRITANEELTQAFVAYAQDPGLFKIVSLKHEFPNEWHLATTTGDMMQITLTKNHFPFFTQQYDINVDTASVYKVNGDSTDSDTSSASIATITAQLPDLSLDIAIDSDEIDFELFLVLQYSI